MSPVDITDMPRHTKRIDDATLYAKCLIFRARVQKSAPRLPLFATAIFRDFPMSSYTLPRGRRGGMEASPPNMIHSHTSFRRCHNMKYQSDVLHAYMQERCSALSSATFQVISRCHRSHAPKHARAG